MESESGLLSMGPLYVDSVCTTTYYNYILFSYVKIIFLSPLPPPPYPDPALECQLFYCTHKNIVKAVDNTSHLTAYGCFIGTGFTTQLSHHNKASTPI